MKTSMEQIVCADKPEVFTISEISASIIYFCIEYGSLLKLGNPLKMLASKLNTVVERIEKDENINDRQRNTCLTPGCVNAASYLLQNMDTAISPCENFYEFACGGWERRAHIDDDKNSVSTFSETDERLTYQVRDLIERNTSKHDLDIFKHVKILYKQCKDEDAIEKIDDKILIAILKDLGGWPVVVGSKWKESEFDWINMTLKFRDLGYGYGQLVSIGVGTDFRNRDRFIITIGEAHLSLAREYLIRNLTDNVLSSYYKFMVESAVLLGADRKTASDELLTVLKFEQKLAELTTSREKSRIAAKFYNKMNIKRLSTLASKIPWHMLISKIFRQNFDGETEPILVGVPTFLTNVSKLIDNTPKQVLANYLIWRLVRSSIDMMGKKWRKLYLEYSKATTGLEVQPPRWRTCIRIVWSEFGHAISAQYVREYFSKASKMRVSKMVERIHQQFLQIIKNTDWMDEGTKRHAEEKALKMKFHVAFPDELMDDKKIAEFYKGVELNPKESYFKTILQLSLWGIEFTHSFLRKKNDRDAWWKYGHSALVNAFYHVFDNSIFLPAGILQNPFFGADCPMYINYGAIGSVIGHEITHGFDDVGRQFDKDGNNIIWWNNATDTRFREKTRCIIDQYSQYEVIDGEKINGINTQGENIADNGGLKEAYFAYKRYEQEFGKELHLPGLNFNSDQLFFLSFANVWCRKVRPKALKMSLELGAHSPGNFRVIGTLSNSNEFAKAFKCPKGSRMNPNKKCVVW
ncbi:membrane metallo-endopeptidase-like 1 isoform X3 [Dinothrombium tinctorium]|uniref:Membrane metallo-endopeptidase-like 1 isoform X3 n=1 Tax=Dinothrombium tinctorium TaxID=1965070 RepID=A0A443RG94_9ACAR|nr:membrane metallo-endopeptidase-like 1 isoform X3 [Dinothrombium tinctorium]